MEVLKNVSLTLFSAALLSSSPQADFGTKRVTLTSAWLAKSMARCRFIVDKPPLDEFHSLAKSITFRVFPHFPGS